MPDILFSWLSSDCSEGNGKKKHKRRNMLIRILFVSLCCLGRHRPARKCRSQRSCWTKGGIQESDATLLGLFVFHFLALIDLVAGKTREAMNVTDSLIGWEVKMQHLLSTFRKESKDWDTLTSSVFNFLSKKTLTEMSIENLFLSYVPEAASVQNFHMDMFV